MSYWPLPTTLSITRLGTKMLNSTEKRCPLHTSCRNVLTINLNAITLCSQLHCIVNWITFCKIKSDLNKTFDVTSVGWKYQCDSFVHRDVRYNRSILLVKFQWNEHLDTNIILQFWIELDREHKCKDLVHINRTPRKLSKFSVGISGKHVLQGYISTYRHIISSDIPGKQLLVTHGVT